MPPKKLKSREGNNSAVLPNLVSKFPFRVGDEVEMKSHESGYRGAWFRVQVKKIRLDRKGNIWSTMVYKDYTDESEEEIRVYEMDPASDERILMVRPLPPPSVKESKFNKSVHTKMCVVYRDEWEVGDLVDWWYHHCWWSAKVISVVGDGRFQLVCPAPPGGEGGVYLANSKDLRPSLKWSVSAQWTAPPSKEIGKIPCARIVWLLDSSEVAGFAAPNQDQVPHKRGRPKLVRGVGGNSLVRKGPPVVTPDKESAKGRRPGVIQLNRPPYYNHSLAEAAAPAPDKDTRVPHKRGRPKKVDGQEEVAKKRRRPIVIKIIHPRQDPGYEKVERMLKSSSVDETGVEVNEERTYDICPTETSREDQTRQETKQDTMAPGKGLGDDNRKWVKKASPATERQPEKMYVPGIEQNPPIVAKQIHEEKIQGVKQKRSAMRIPNKVKVTEENHISNGHSDEAKRRKLDHIRRVSEPGVRDEHRRKNVQDQDGKKPQKWTADEGGGEAGGHTPKYGLLTVPSTKSSKKHMKFANKVAENSTLVSRVGDVVVENLLDLVPGEQFTLPCLSEGKESSADQISGQRSKAEKQNVERQVEVFSSNFASNPMNGEANGEACKEALDLKVLKVLNAYEEAFTDALLNDSCPRGLQKSVLATKDPSVVKNASEEAVTGKAIRSPRKKSSLAQDPSPASSKLAKSQEFPVSCNQKKPQVSSTCKGISSPNIKSSTLQDRHAEKAANVSALMSHEFIIGTAASSMDTISVGGSPDSFSGRIATVSIEEDMKDTASSHGGASVVDEEDSWSSLESSRVNQSRKSGANAYLSASPDPGPKAEKSDKNDFFALRKRNISKSVMKRKVSLSRKLIDHARREVSAKRRRSYRSTETGRA